MDMENKPSVSVISPVYNGGPHYPVCFESLCRLAYPPERLEVHIIDDGSTDGTREFLQAQAPPSFVHVHLLDRNIGLGQARNHGLRLATGEVVVLLDGDMEVSPDFIENHVSELAKPGREAIISRVEPATWIAGTKLNRYLYEYPHRGARQFDSNTPLAFQYLLSNNTAYSRVAIEAGGRYDTFRLYGGEDTLFAYRVARRFPDGIYYSDKPTAIHHHDWHLPGYLEKLHHYGYSNLPQIISHHPELATTLAADFAWPLAGIYFRFRRALGRLLFNPVTCFLGRALLPVTPFPISHTLVRFLVVASVVRGLRQYVRKQNGFFSNTDH